MNYGRPHKPCCPQHNTCQACGEQSPCREVLTAEVEHLEARIAGLVDQLDEWRARCERTAVLTATTEGSTR